MTDPLYISEEDPIRFDGTLDGSSALQLLHGTESLAYYNQTVHAEHRDLLDSAGIVRVELHDFTVSGVTWQLTAQHNPGSGLVSWSRSSAGYAYFDFGPMTEELEVDVTATSNSSPPQTKTRTARIKISPTDAQPDRPRR